MGATSLIIACFFVGAIASNPEENAHLRVGEEDLFEGDIKLTSDQQAAEISRASIKTKLWTGGVLPYEIDASLSSQPRAMTAIKLAMDAWEQTTCIRFKNRTTESTYVSFFRGSGCWSYVGMTRGKQQLSLAGGCWYKGTVIHEIGHALGFYHEQSRPDRDNYVTIKWENIYDNNKHNFNKYTTGTINSLGTSYDYGSIMHYGEKYFSKNGQPTIVPKKAGVTIGNRHSMSSIDIKQMNLLYKCNNGGTPPPTTWPPTASPPTGTGDPGQCGKRPAGTRVVGGQNAAAHAWPWQISLRVNGGHICGGTLIDAEHVVTAAHCVYRNPYPSGYTVVVGSHRRTFPNTVEQTRRLKALYKHSGFSMSNLRDDIALLQLESPVQLSDKVSPACLPTSKPAVGAKCYITGWGRISGGGPAADILQQAVLPVVSTNDCRNKYGSLIDENAHLCAGSGQANSAGGCNGDSGGPLVCEQGGRWFLHGAVSFGQRYCPTTHFTVFARVTSYIKWINDRRGAGTPSPPTTSPVPASTTEVPIATTASSCSDRLSQKDCDYYKNNGYCKSYVESMKYYCPKTCYSCGNPTVPVTTAAPPTTTLAPTTTGSCSDRLSQKDCDYYKNNGYCKSYVESMKYYCPKTCYSCGNPTVPVTTATRPTTTLAPTTTGSCSDRMSQSQCESYKKYGYCKSYVESMKYYCPKTCYSCGTPPPPTTQATPAPPSTPPIDTDAPPASCGSRPNTRIVGGTQAPQHTWPWQAQLRRTWGGPFCGGSLVHPQWIVTATHCIAGKQPSSVKIRLGAHHRTNNLGNEQDIAVEKIIQHESYHSPLRYSNDIALIKLQKPAVLNKAVGLVCLPDASNQLPIDNISKKCWITGWGTLSSGGNVPSYLMQASVPLVSKSRCSKAYPGSIHDSMLCAGLDQGGVDSCQGDSGGPLVCEYNGRWFLEGATSWGYGCASPKKYGVYAHVRHLQAWLERKMREN